MSVRFWQSISGLADIHAFNHKYGMLIISCEIVKNNNIYTAHCQTHTHTPYEINILHFMESIGSQAMVVMVD